MTLTLIVLKKYYSVIESQHQVNWEKEKFNDQITDFGINQTWAQIPALLLTSCMTFS